MDGFLMWELGLHCTLPKYLMKFAVIRAEVYWHVSAWFEVTGPSFRVLST